MSENEHCCKLSRTAEKYDVAPGAGDETLDDQLAKRWTGEGKYPEMSLRTLVDWFHKHVLRTRYTDLGRSTLEPHLESDYQALQSPGDDTHHAVRSDLKSDGIDAEALVEDFVSASTLYRHLTGCLGVEKAEEPSGTAPDRETLNYVENTAEMYVSDLLSAWEHSGETPRATDADIVVRVYLECPECAKQTNIRTVKQRGYICKKHMTEQSTSVDTDTT